MPKIKALFPAAFISKNNKQLTAAGYAFIILVCIAFFIPGIATLPPTDRDESSFAQATKQMIETENYVDIRLQKEPRYKKPIGIYWLQAASVQLFDADHLNEIWAYRLPSFLGATVAVTMTAAIGTLFFGPIAGLMAALMMAGCVVLNVEARMAKTDAALLGSIMVMQYALARAYVKKAKDWGMPFAFWTALGIGILIKGPIILLILASTLIWLRVTQKNLNWFSALKPWVGLPYVLMITMPWFIAISMQSHGLFIEKSAGQDLLTKLWQGESRRGFTPPGLHTLLFPVVFFPFSLLALLAIPDVWQNRHKSTVQFCLGWIVPALILFEISLNKLPHYTMPIFPAITILTGKIVWDGYPVLMKKTSRWWLIAAVSIWMTLGTILAVGAAVLPYLCDHVWNIPQILAGLVILIAQGISLGMLVLKKPHSILVLSLGSLFFISCTFGYMLPNLQHLWVSREIAQMVEKVKPCENTHIISATYGEPSLVFLTNTDTEITPDGVWAAKELATTPCSIVVLDGIRAPNFYHTFESLEQQPTLAGIVEGTNLGSGAIYQLKLFVMPKKATEQ